MLQEFEGHLACYMGLLGSEVHLLRASSVNCSAISPAFLHPLLMEEKKKRKKKGGWEGGKEGGRGEEERKGDLHQSVLCGIIHKHTL